jgi:NAD(P)-dependent dehydrogenase (short-subunit alcohol dehydrogenase family)
MKRLQDKTAVITGGTSGIGLAGARLFADEGATVIISGRDEERLGAAQRALGSRVHGVRSDVTDTDDVSRLVAEATRLGGGIDVLWVNAAVVRLAPIGDTGDQLFDEVVATNLKGAFKTLQLAIPALRDGGSVILTTSWLNRIGFAGASVVSMTKAALRSLARVAAAELAPRKIRVNALCPGAIETPLWGRLGLPSDVLQAAGAAITAQVPLGRWGQADEVARAALFLASNESSYVNGTELQVDGGMRQA